MRSSIATRKFSFGLRWSLFAALLTAGLLGAGVRSAREPWVAPSINGRAAAVIPAVARFKALDQFPLSFEANRGQAAAPIKFLARGRGYALGLKTNEAILHLQRTVERNSAEQRRTRAALFTNDANNNNGGNGSDEGVTVRMKFTGANPQPLVKGLGALPGATNYLIGNDPRRWQTDVTRYAKVEYEDLYPGVNLVYYGRQRELEYDLIVKPGADPRRIKLSFAGAERMAINEQGELILHTAEGEVVQHAPVVYQMVNDERRAVTGRYLQAGRRTVGFEIGDYDASRALVIDPVLSYAAYFGNSSGSGNGVAVDPAGNAYVVGTTSAPDFLTINPAQATAGGGVDVFVTKFNPVGLPVYSTYLGGAGSDFGFGIAVDDDGNAYVTGLTTSSNFPVVNAFQSARRGSSEGFVAKLNAMGNALVYSTYLGGADFDEASSIAVDAARHAYVTGDTDSDGFPTTPGAFRTRLGAQFATNAFVTKFNVDGRTLAYSTCLGGSDFDLGFGVAVDAGGNAAVTGSAGSADFPTTPGAAQTQLNGGADAFITKLNPTGSALVFSTFFGGSDDESGYGLAIEATGAVYVAGETSSRDFTTTPGATQRAYGGGLFDVFSLKLSATGAVLFASYLGGSGVDSSGSISVDSAGNSYLAGLTKSRNFPTVAPLQAAIGSGGLFRSSDGAGQWSAGNTGLDDLNVLSLAIAPTTPATLYAGTESGAVYRSTDGGASWSAGSQGLSGKPIYTLVVDPANPLTLYAGSDGAVFKSNNSGQSWTARTMGFEFLDSLSVRSLVIDRATPMTVYAGALFGRVGVYKSTDGGDAWRFTGPNELIRALAGDPSASLTLYAGTSSRGVYKTTNGGNSWSQTNTGLTNLAVRALAVDPVTPQTLYVGTTGGVFKSANGGGSWSAAGAGLTSLSVRALAIDPANPGTLYAGTGSGVFKSANGGGAWQAANTNLDSLDVLALAIDPRATSTIYAGTNGQDAFVVKVSPTGALLFSTYLGGNASDFGSSVAVDANGSVYATGGSSSTNFPITQGAPQGGLKGASNAFIVKLSDAFNCTLTCSVTAPNIGAAGLPVAFTAAASGCAGGATQVWDFGDNSARLAQDNPSHIYFAPGTYTWTLATINSGASACSQTGAITITGRGAASVSAASYLGDELARDSIVAAFGVNLATTTQAAPSTPLPTTLAGVTVRIRDSAGSERLAPLFFVAPGQVNYLLPAELAPGLATITITSGDGAVSLGAAQISGVAPGLFTANADGRGAPAAVALRVRSGAQSIEPVVRVDSATNRFTAIPLDLGPETDQVFLILFGTGLRGRSALTNLSAKLGSPAGVDANVMFAGPQGGFVGLDQINLGPLPRSLAGRGEVDVLLIVDGKTANTVRINIK